jgi:hypothetical protein
MTAHYVESWTYEVFSENNRNLRRNISTLSVMPVEHTCFCTIAQPKFYGRLLADTGMACTMKRCGAAPTK